MEMEYVCILNIEHALVSKNWAKLEHNYFVPDFRRNSAACKTIIVGRLLKVGMAQTLQS